jgi:4-hydroxy-2-oxoheptanedioate aldolase
MNGKQLLSILKNGKRIYGTAIICSSPIWPQALENAAIDFVFLDTEHIPLGREQLSKMCQIYNKSGLPSIVRIPSPDPFEACKVLDGGAVGIVAPYIETVDQVRELVGATKLRPLKGMKLKSILENQVTPGSRLKKYLDDRNENNILFINFESVPALENLDEILTVPGLDGLIIGPHDLSCSLEVPEDYQNPIFQDAVTTIIKKTRDSGLPIGIHLSEQPELQIQWAKAGVNIILHSSDISLFGRTLRNDIMKIRKALDQEIGEIEDKKIII